MKKKLILPSALAALSFLGGSMLTSCSSEEEQTSAISAATVAERAEAFTALAYLPKDADNFIAVNVKNTINVLDTFTQNEASKSFNNGLSRIDPSISYVLKSLDSIAIGTPTEDEAVVKAVFQLVPLLLHSEIDRSSFRTLQSHIDPLLNNVISSYGKLKPTYLVATFTDKEAASQTNTMLQAAAIMGVQQAKLPASTFEQNGWKGYKMNLGDLARMTDKDDFIQQFAQTNAYLVSRQENNAVIIAFCTDSSLLSVPSAAANSVLTSQGAEILKDANGTNTLAVASVSADSIQSVITAANESAKSYLSLLQQHSILTPRQVNAAMGIIQELTPLTERDIKHPLSAMVWADDNLHLNVECDSLGAEFTSAQVPTTAPADAMIYAYGSTLQGYPKINIAKLSAAIADSINASEPWADDFPTKDVLIKDIEPLVNNAYNFADALGNGWSFTMDLNAKRKSRLDWSDENSGYVYSPDERPAFCIQLKDRRAAEKAYNATIASLADVVTKYNPVAREEVLQSLATNKVTKGNITHYTYIEGESPNPAEFSAGYALTDSAVCIGPHRQLNTQCITAPTNGSVSGIHVTYNFKNDEILRREMYLQKEKARLAYYQKQLETASDSSQYNSYYYESPQERVQQQQQEVQWEQNLLDERIKFHNTFFSGLEADLTTDGGKLKLHIKAITPCLKRGK